MAALQKITVGQRDDGKDGDSNRAASLKHNANIDALSGQLPLGSVDVIKVPQVMTNAHLGKRVNINLAVAGTLSLPVAANCPFDSVVLLRNVGATVVTLAPAPGSADTVTLSSLLPGESAVLDTDGVATWSSLIRSRSTADSEATIGSLSVGGNISSGGKQVAVNSPNLVYNGSGEFGTRGWSSGPTILSVISSSDGTFFSAAPSSTAVTGNWSSAAFRVTGGIPHNVQGEILVDASSTGSFYIDVNYFSTTDGTGPVLLDGANFNRSRASLGLWQFVAGVDLAVPAGAQSARVRIVASAAKWATLQFRRLKVEMGTAPSTYSLESAVVYLASPDAGARLIGAPRIFTSSGTYTPTPGTSRVIVEVQGGGAAGGGSAATGAGQFSGGGSGGAGGYAKQMLMSDFAGVAVVVGAGGVGGPGTTGGSGGASSFGAVTAAGGTGGGVGAASTSVTVGVGGAGGGASGGFLNIPGGAGSNSIISAVSASTLVNGGASVLGSGGRGVSGSAAPPGGGFGGGGSGPAFGPASAAVAGGNGAPGVVIVWEYA
ncbi:hypothetical protein [Pandoraea sputorum]|uniref:glycine-rich domain-containing protein n=1 Tax=Pandoraea sputorum TaxID=93222 RepID=UPI002F90E7BA